MGAGSVDPLGLAFDLVASMGLGGQVLGGGLPEPRVSRARLSSDGVGPSCVKFLKKAGAKPEGSDPEGGDEGVEIDLDDEPRSLQDFLNAWRRKVAKSSFRMIYGLPHHI